MPPGGKFWDILYCPVSSEVNEGDVVENFHFSGKRFTVMTNGTRATVGFAPANTVISTGQRATFGSAYTLDGVGNRTRTDLAGLTWDRTSVTI